MASLQFSLAAVGTAVLSYKIFQALTLVWTMFLRPSELPRYGHCEDGSWAFVTGASDGIGLGFVHELLSENFNVLMHGRNADKLKRIAQELRQQYPHRTVAIVVADASDPGVDFSAIVDIVKSLPGKLTVLINNVGGVTTKPQYLALTEVPAEDVDGQINVNARFPTHITKVLLPILKENQPSLVLNCGSVGAFFGPPYIATYVATKGYIHGFTRSLVAEMIAEDIAPSGGNRYEAAKGVEVLGCLIGNVTTAGNDSEKDFSTIGPRECASACLDRVGSGKALVWAHWKHRLQWLVVCMMPESVARNLGVPIMKKRAEKERAEAKKGS